MLLGGFLVWQSMSPPLTQQNRKISLVSRICLDIVSRTIEQEKLVQQSERSINNQTNCTSQERLIETDGGISPLMIKLINNRSILKKDLSVLSHWVSFSDFISTLNSQIISDSDHHHLLAKAEIYFRGNYLAAIEALYSAQQSVSSDEKSDTIQGEINALLNYVRIQYFSENSVISIEWFTGLMNLAHEKQPNDISVIIALVRHYLLVGEYALASNFINRIPPDIDNLVTIELLNNRLEKNRLSHLDNSKGIALTKRGNHYIVKVEFNQQVSLNLMLDTGASRTVVSNSTMASMQSISDYFVDLDISGRARTANGIAHTRLYTARDMRVDDFVLEHPLILTSNIPKDENMDGLLGMDFLSQFKFRIDHQNNRLYLSY